jgi:hypothetical protein
MRKDDPYILPQPGEHFSIRMLGEIEGLELADALLENKNITSEMQTIRKALQRQ